MYEAKILQHSTTNQDVELVTFEVNWPHPIHKDGMTHRWARNFQSFRAVPPEVLIAKIEAGEYFRPEQFSGRIKGMGVGEAKREAEQKVANEIWDDHVRDCVRRAKMFLEMDIAKEQINFLLQDLCFIRGIITTTLPQLTNFFGLRTSLKEDGTPFARAEVYKIASMMKEVYERSTPWVLNEGEWHLPLVNPKEMGNAWSIDWKFWRKVSVGRCARVSYLTHDGVRDPAADVALHDSLLTNGHMSPFEHQGTPSPTGDMAINLAGSFGHGWVQYRKLIPGESNYYDLQKRV